MIRNSHKISAVLAHFRFAIHQVVTANWRVWITLLFILWSVWVLKTWLKKDNKTFQCRYRGVQNNNNQKTNLHSFVYLSRKNQNGGSPFQNYDPTPAIQLWATSATRHPNQSERKSYKARETTKREAVLIDGSSPEEDSDNSEWNE